MMEKVYSTYQKKARMADFRAENINEDKITTS